MMKKKLNRYAVTYLPSKNGFAVNKLKKGEYVKKRYASNTTYVKAKSSADAWNRVSKRSYAGEIKKKMRK